MASRERLHSIPLTALVLFFLILGSSGASAGTETQLTHNARLTDSTAIYGNIVTWSETAGNGVHVYDIAAGKEIDVGTTEGNVPVYGNNIIWADMDGNIRMYDVSTDNVTNISDGNLSDGDLPDIYGNYVVYTKYYYIQDHKNDGIYLYDLNTHNETKIASVHGYPAIYDKKVVWSQANSNNGYDIYKYDISTNQTNIITTADSYVSKLDIYGNVVVWTESYKVYMYDMASHKTTQVTNTGHAYDPAIDGDRIVYTLSESHSSDIYMYEISTSRTTRITTSTRAFSPSIYEDKIIYADLRNPENPDVRDIFLYDLSSTVQNPLVAEFTANVTSGTAPLVVLFTDTSTGGVPTSWHWDTGDGIYSKHAMNATHTFTKPGSYTVSLTVGNAVGNSTATKPNYIVVTDPNAPVTNFNSSVTEGYAPLTVQFNDISQNAMSRVWDFDSDGKADSTEVSPVYTYTTPGTYTVNLTVRNAYGTTSKTGTITVLTENGPNIGAETRITTSELASHPDIYDNRIVWQDWRNGNYDIYMYDLSTSKETRITTNESNQIYPAIYGDRIVWQDDRNGQYDIYMYDISTSTEIRISTYESDQDHPGIYGNRHPDIYGERIVWDDYRNGLPDIYMCDLSTSKETQITTHESNQEFPAIYGDRVVWQDRRKGGSDIYMYNLSTSEEIPIATNQSWKCNLVICGNRIVWEDWRNGSSGIYTYDLSTSRETQITNSGSADSPAIYNDKIVWEDKRTGNWDIYIYNLATSKETQITNDESNQESPAIYDNRIVWQDRRKGGSDIYICTISKEKTKPIIPAVDFSANVTSGYTPLSVQFTDLSQHSTSRSWDFGDGATSTEQNPQHTYSAAGTYAVNLTAGNANGTSLKTAQITVLETSSSSGESSGGSSHSSSGSSDGGGAGGSPEPQNNVEIKELSQAFITNGKSVKFDFTKNATCVVYVSFDSKKTFGKTTAIAEQLKGKSTLVSKLPYGEVYKSFNIWVGNGGVATSKNIENPVVCFKVEKTWIKDKKIDLDSITLNRYIDKKWDQFPVNLSGEDNKFLYFTAKTSGFSSFAITGTAKPSEETVMEVEVDYPETINNNTENKEPQKEQKEILKTPGFEIYYGVASLLVVLLYKRR